MDDALGEDIEQIGLSELVLDLSGELADVAALLGVNPAISCARSAAQ